MLNVEQESDDDFVNDGINYNYCVRAYILDVETNSWMGKRLEKSVGIVKSLCSRFHLGSDVKEISKCLCMRLNARMFSNPKYYFQYCFNSLIDFENIDVVLDRATKSELRAIRFFLFVAYKYGFFL